MIAKLLIHPNLQTRVGEADKILVTHNLHQTHVDVLWLDEEKLGVEQAKRIRQHLSLKPYSAKGRAVVVLNSHLMTPAAQNSLLKTLEEPPEEAIILLGAESDRDILPTILSRVQVVTIERGKGEAERGKENSSSPLTLDPSPFSDDIEKLLNSTIEQRFEYIEKLEDKEAFFHGMLTFFHAHFPEHPKYPEFTKELLQAEAWKDANGNLRAILEYLMLKLPHL